MNHHCHAQGCTTKVPPAMFMCKTHWYMVPKPDRDKVWALYVPGQEIRKDPTEAYVTHTMHCIDVVARKEGLRA